MRKRQPVEVADIFRSVVSAGELSASKEQWKIVNAILQCRTSALGGHLYRCRDCGREEPQYNSCRNRHCPKCQGADIAKWMKARESELLPAPYFHTVFTVPHELNAVFLQNKKELYSLLFRAVSETLKKAALSRYGGTCGFFGVLHTWGQKLEAHPHIHCVMPGVIVKPDGEVVQTRENYFLPDRILEKLFRGIFLEGLERLYSKGKLAFFQNAAHLKSPSEFKKLLKSAATHEWVVYSKAPFAGPRAVLKYLSRYTHRVAISNSRIKTVERDTVQFSYKDYSKNGKRKIASMKASEFTRRVLLHTLPHQFVRIRHFGFLANRNKKQALQKINLKLGNQSQYGSPNPEKPLACSQCGSINLSKTKLQKATRPSFRLINKKTSTIIPHRRPPPTL